MAKSKKKPTGQNDAEQGWIKPDQPEQTAPNAENNNAEGWVLAAEDSVQPGQNPADAGWQLAAAEAPGEATPPAGWVIQDADAANTNAETEAAPAPAAAEENAPPVADVPVKEKKSEKAAGFGLFKKGRKKNEPPKEKPQPEEEQPAAEELPEKAETVAAEAPAAVEEMPLVAAAKGANAVEEADKPEEKSEEAPAPAPSAAELAVEQAPAEAEPMPLVAAAAEELRDAAEDTPAAPDEKSDVEPAAVRLAGEFAVEETAQEMAQDVSEPTPAAEETAEAEDAIKPLIVAAQEPETPADDVTAEEPDAEETGQEPNAQDEVAALAVLRGGELDKREDDQAMRAGDTRIAPTVRPTKVTAPKTAPSPRETARRKREKRVTRSAAGIFFASIFKVLFVLGCLGLIALSVVAVQVASYMVEATAEDDTLLDIESIRLNETSYFYVLDPDKPDADPADFDENDWVQYQELVGPEHRIWVTIDQIPDYLVDAVIAIEDREFETHHGVDIRRTFAAMVNEFIPISANTFGASTIEQQLIKNITGEKQVDGESGYKRKMREIYRAWCLDNRYTKEMIMEAYLNTISLSGTIGGVEAGAQEYFNKTVNDLTLAECALIAGITRAPGAYNPFVHPDNALTRRNSVLKQMLDTEKITQQEYDEAVRQPLGVVDRASGTRLQVGDAVFSYFSDQLFNDVVNDLMRQKNMSKEAAETYLYTGGLRVYGTLDLNIQTPLEEMYLNGYEEDGWFAQKTDPRSGLPYIQRLTVEEEDEDGNIVEVLPQSAVSVIDYDGALKAVVGGIGPKTESRSLNRATQSPRQVGSTMKPIAAYALGIDTGVITYSSPVVDSGVRNLSGNTTVDPETGLPNYNWPQNYSRTYRNTAMPVVSAVAESTNTVAVKVGMRVGVPDMFDFLQDTLQISTLESEGAYNDLDLAPLVLGSQTHGITTYELAGAYMMFGNGGEFNSLHSYYYVTDSHGNVILEPERTTVQAISPDSAYVMNRILYAVTHNGVAPGVAATGAGIALEGEMESVGKTGTTDEDKNRWFVGLTPYYVTAVWWGYDDNYALNWSPNGRTNITTNVWKELMEEVQADMPYKEFPEKPDTVTVAAYCIETGELAGGGCGARSTGYYTGQRVPDTCKLHNGGEGAEYFTSEE